MIAIVGAAGQLGSAFARHLGAAAIALTRADFDVTDTESMRAVLTGRRPHLIINCAAYTAVERAEAEPDRAFAVNAHAVGVMAGIAAEIGAAFATFSTDYVFNGTKRGPYVESDEPDPLNVYGASKLEGERLALDTHPGPLVVRTSWLLSATHPNFVATILDRVLSGPVHVADDQFGRPTIADDLVAASMATLAAGADGVLHLANTPTVSWFELAREAVRLAGLDPAMVEPRASEAGASRVRRPANSALASERLERIGIDPLPPFAAGLQAVVAGHGPQSRS